MTKIRPLVWVSSYSFSNKVAWIALQGQDPIRTDSTIPHPTANPTPRQPCAVGERICLASLSWSSSPPPPPPRYRLVGLLAGMGEEREFCSYPRKTAKDGEEEERGMTLKTCAR